MSWKCFSADRFAMRQCSAPVGDYKEKFPRDEFFFFFQAHGIFCGRNIYFKGQRDSPKAHPSHFSSRTCSLKVAAFCFMRSHRLVFVFWWANNNSDDKSVLTLSLASFWQLDEKPQVCIWCCITHRPIEPVDQHSSLQLLNPITPIMLHNLHFHISSLKSENVIACTVSAQPCPKAPWLLLRHANLISTRIALLITHP